jgi:hypothetical protein
MAQPGEQLALVGVGEKPLIERIWQRTSRIWPSIFTFLRALLEMGAHRPLALVADEQQHRIGSPTRFRRWPRTRPPVSIPFDATIMYGRVAWAIAFESGSFRVSVWLG